jgi:hypothetical protein
LLEFKNNQIRYLAIQPRNPTKVIEEIELGAFGLPTGPIGGATNWEGAI